MTEKRFKKISDFSKVRRGASPRPIDDPRYFGGDVGWVRIADVTASKKYLKRTTQYVSELGEKNSVRVDKGDLIMSICGTIGRPVIIDIPACIHDGFVQLYDIKDSDTEFLYYSLQFSEEALKAQGQSGTQTNLNTSIVSDLEIFHPSYEEQARIADVLSHIDQAIEQAEAVIAKQQRIKAGLMQDLLTKGVDADGNIRSEESHEFKDSPLGRIPTEWNWSPLKNYYACTSRNGLYKPQQNYGSGSPMIHMPQMFRGLEVEDSDAVRVSVTPKELKRFGLEEGDILFARRSLTLEGAGQCSLVKKLREPTTFESSIIRVRLRKDEIRPAFVNQFLNTEVGYRLRLPLIRQVAVSGVSSEDIATIPVPCPLIDEQDIILSRVEACDLNIERELRQREKLVNLKVGLMQDLLSGIKSVETLLEFGHCTVQA